MKSKQILSNLINTLDKLSFKMVNIFNPKCFNLKVCKGCNYMCEFCSLWQREEIEPIQLEEICKKINYFVSKGAKEVNIIGGESLLNENLPKVLSYAKNAGLKTNLYTNGLLYPHFAENLKYFADVVYLMINHPVEQDHNRISGINSYKQVIESLNMAKDFKQKLILNVNVQMESITFLPELQDLAQEYGVGMWLNPVFYYLGFTGMQRESKDYIKRYFLVNGVEFNLAAFRYPKSYQDRTLCLALDSHVEDYDNPLKKEFYKNYYSKFKHGIKKLKW